MPSDIRKGVKMSMTKVVLYPFANNNDGIVIEIKIDARNMSQVRSFQTMDPGSNSL